MEGNETAKPKLLVIDDDRGILETFTDLFVERGYSVDTAGTGKSALEKSRKTPYDIALIDIRLPDIGGIDLLKNLKKDRPDMACIIITGNATLQNAIDALGDGACGYFVKPLVIREVIHRIDEEMEKLRLQRKLSESLKRYQGLVETSADAIISANSAGEIIQWNDAASRIFGYSPEEIIGRKLDVLIPEKDEKRHRDAFAKHAKAGKSRLVGRTVEREGLHKDGSIIPVEISLSASKETGPSVFTSIIRDVTKRKERDEALRESEEKYRLFFENSPLGVLHYDQKGVVTACNENFTKIIGAPKEKIIGFDMMTSLKDEKMIAAVTAPFSGKPGHFEGDYLSVTGGKLSALKADFSPIQSEDGSFLGAVGILEDITVRKEAEEVLRYSSKKYRDLVDNALVGIYKTNLKGEIRYANEALLAMFEYESPEELRKGGAIPTYKTKKDRKILIEKLRKTGKVDNFELELLTKTKQIKNVLLSATLDGDIISGMIMNVTGRRRAEERLAKINECFLEFGSDPRENINRLTAVCGELLEATCALYNRLDKEMLCSWGQWHTPPDYNPVDKPDGHICHDVIKRSTDRVFIVRNLQKTRYAQTDPNVRLYKLQTYIGRAVKFGNTCLGSLCVVYQKDKVPSEEDKRVLEIMASAIGVEETRGLAEDALKTSEERYRLLFENASDAIFITDIKNEKLLYVNRMAEKLTGRTRKELVGMHRLKLHPKEMTSYYTKHFRGHVTSGSVIDDEAELEKKDGTIVPVLISASVSEIGGKKVIQGIYRDITDRKHAEDEMLKKFLRYRVEKGEVYLIKEQERELSTEVFKDLLGCGFSGTVFSRTKKEELQKAFGKVKSFWLTERPKTKDAIRPKFSVIESCIESIGKGNHAVLLDRMDYLITKNGFEKTLRFVQRLFEQAYHQKLIVILALDSSTLRPREIRLLEKETKRLEPKVKSKIPLDIHEILKFVYSKNRIGEYPSFKDVHEKFKITRTTARNRIKRLRAMELLIDKKRGRTKVLEITEKGREQF